MKNLTKSSAVLLSLALALTSAPLPALAGGAVMRGQVGQNVNAGVPVLPVNAARANLGSGMLLAAPQGLTLNNSLSLPQSPMVAGPAALAGQAFSAPGEQGLAVPGIAVAPQARTIAAPGEPGLAVPEGQTSSLPEGDVAAAQPKTILGRLGDAIRVKLGFGRVFDNSKAAAPGAVLGILPHKSQPQGVILDEAPSAPDTRKGGGVSIENYDFPGTLATGEDIFGAGPAVLAADPASVTDVERALRSLVDSDPVKYGIPSAQLSTVHVKRVAGVGHQADTIYAFFRQQKNGMEMHGSFLSFTVKVIQGKPVVMASMAKLFPNAPVDTTPRFPDEELKDKALERLGPYTQMYNLEASFLEKKIVFVKGAWHAANIYLIEGGPAPIAIAVDVASGEAFAWDPRAGAVSGEAAAEGQTGGRVLGHTTTKGPTKPDSPMADRPLPDLNVTLGDGKVVITDADGKFTVASGIEALAANFKAVLAGKWAKVSNASGGNLQVSGTLENGKEVAVTFNPAGMTEDAIAQINGYLLTTLVHDWAKSRGIDDARIDKAIPVRVNIDDECNAYYTPGRPSLNFFKSSENCVNSSYDTVVMHEYGHFIDDMIGGITNGGLSEGWGDIFSMYILNNPIIGEGFLKKPRGGVDYIRHGDNDYQYRSSDEVHDQGQAWGGFAWKLRKTLMANLGDAAGAAIAEALVVPTIFAKASNIPAAMAQVLLNDMDANGAIPHEAEIRAAAKAHGVTLPKNPGKIAALARRMTNWVLGMGLSYQGAEVEGGQGRMSFQADQKEQPNVKAKMTFTAGALLRGRVRRALEQFLDQQEGITYTLKEYKSWTSSDYLLVIEGPQDKVQRTTDAIQAWFRSLERDN